MKKNDPSMYGAINDSPCILNKQPMKINKFMASVGFLLSVAKPCFLMATMYFLAFAFFPACSLQSQYFKNSHVWLRSNTEFLIMSDKSTEQLLALQCTMYKLTVAEVSGPVTPIM